MCDNAFFRSPHQCQTTPCSFSTRKLSEHAWLIVALLSYLPSISTLIQLDCLPILYQIDFKILLLTISTTSPPRPALISFRPTLLPTPCDPPKLTYWLLLTYWLAFSCTAPRLLPYTSINWSPLFYWRLSSMDACSSKFLTSDKVKWKKTSR